VSGETDRAEKKRALTERRPLGLMSSTDAPPGLHLVVPRAGWGCWCSRCRCGFPCVVGLPAPDCHVFAFVADQTHSRDIHRHPELPDFVG